MRHCRNSSFELLKIVGIVLIVFNHVVQSLSVPNDLTLCQDYVYDISHATQILQGLIISMMRYLGNVGNTVFFVCSAWFLLDSENVNWRKTFQIAFDAWIISIILFAFFFFVFKVDLSSWDILRQFFPTLFGNNWYITCYLLFYMIHPMLNAAIRSLGKVSCFYLAAIGFFLYFVLSFLSGDLYFFSSTIVYWCVIYFIVAYIKRYLPIFVSDGRVYYSLIVVGLIGTLGLVIFTNYLGLRYEFFSSQLQRWNLINNPFILSLVMGLLLWASNHSFYSRTINYVSSLSLFVYIIHENFIFRKFYRPVIWQNIYNSYGYDYILLWVFVIAIVILLSSMALSILYKMFSQRIMKPFADRLYRGICVIVNKCNFLILKMQ